MSTCAGSMLIIALVLWAIGAGLLKGESTGHMSGIGTGMGGVMLLILGILMMMGSMATEILRWFLFTDF